jgi:peroxiredoxin Q/BCP
MLQVGDPAPAFNLASDGGRSIDSSALAGRPLRAVLLSQGRHPGLHPRGLRLPDDMPGFISLGVPVFGVSADRVPAHDRFVKKHGLNFPLLSDPDHGLLQAYGVWVEKSLYGRKYFGIHRSSFVVGADGRIEKSLGQGQAGHARGEVLAWLSEHAPAGAKAARRR